MSYDNGCSDPDYYDVEFREQHPEVYGDDELMQSYRGSRYNRNQNRRYSKYNSHRGKKDETFHQEYLQWRKNHQDKIKFFQSPGYNSKDTVPIWPSILIGVVFYTIIIFAIIQSCE